MNKMPLNRRALQWLCSGVAMLLSFAALAQQPAQQPLVQFCWADTWPRGAGTIPASCGANAEHNGALCYSSCPAGYTSNGVDECIQNCPSGFHDDGLYCNAGGDLILKPYTVFAKDQCPKENPQGCFQDAALWYPNCPQGKKYSGAGVCVPNVDCGSLNPPMGARIANSCTKKIQIRAPAVASCSSDTENNAGLCYKPCNNGIGQGPLCKSVAPYPGASGPNSTWVTCGAGYAWNQQACSEALSDQVLSVLEAAAQTTLLVASLGASAAEAEAVDAAKASLSAAKQSASGAQKLGMQALKEATKVEGPVEEFTNSMNALGKIKQLPAGAVAKSVGSGLLKGAVGKIPDGVNVVQAGIDNGFNIDSQIQSIEASGQYPTAAEQAIAKADLALNTIAIVDPTGAAGIAAAYTKPLCSQIGEASIAAKATPPISGALANLVMSGEIEKNFKNQIAGLDQQIKAAQVAVATAQAQLQTGPADTHTAAAATLAAKQATLTTLTKRRALAVSASAKFDGYRAQYASMASSTSASTAPAREPPQAHEANVGGWNSLGAVARDVAVGANGTMWYIGAGASGSADGPIYRMGPQGPQEMPGAAQRIAVDPNGNAWVVNSSGAIFKWSGSAWQTMPGTASDIGIGANGAVWAIGGNQTIWRWTGSNWAQMPGGAVRISVDPNGNAWVVNAEHQIYRYVNNAWQLMIGAATDVGVGADGTVYVIGVDQSAAGGQLYHWDPNISNWAAEPGAVGSSVAAGMAGVVYVARAPRSGLPILAKTH